MSLNPALWLLLADATHPVQRAAGQSGGMSDEMKLAITVGATLLLSAILAVFYLGRKVGAFGATVTAFTAQVRAYDESTKEATRLGEKWNSELLAALREVDERVSDALMRITELEYQKRTEKNLPDRVKVLEEWRHDVDTRCKEREARYRYEGSKRILIQEEAAPGIDDLFEASERRCKDEDGGNK
jgi:hypothetical protein